METKTKQLRKRPVCRCNTGLYCSKHYLYATTDYKFAKGKDREAHDQVCGGGRRIVRKRLEG